LPLKWALAAKDAMKYFVSLFLFSFSAMASVPHMEIECPEFDPKVALELEPSKKYFSDSVRSRVIWEKASNDELIKFAQQFEINQVQIQLSNNSILAKKIGAPIVYSMKYYRAKYFGRENHLTTHHVPAEVTFKTPQGYLAGDSRGEFGGELVFVDLAGNVSILQNMNVKDIYKLNFGYVITEGLSHMSSDNGMVYLVTFKQNKPEVSKLFGLLGSPKSSLKMKSGDLLIHSREGSQLLKSDGSFIRVQCKGS
jgi:hypothetical protein